MACALKLPVVFVCENNEYGEFTAREKTMAITDIVDRAAGYGMPGVIVDGMDVVAIHEAATEAVDRARRGEGPSLIEAKTYRYYNHHGIQNLGLKYRTDDEVAEWRERDPIFTFEERLIEMGTATRDDIDGDLGRTASRHRHGDRVRREQPGPDTRPVARRRVHPRARTDGAGMTRKLTYGQAFNEAVRQEMAANDDVFCAGEDIGAFGGVFQTYAGLQAEFGERRVVDTPISEQAIIGLGVGAAVTGLRPIVDIMFMDFICVAFDQIVNQAAKLKYMFGGAATIPLTITTGGGAGLSAAAQHSQSLEALICHIPGLKVVHPSNPYDMKGLMTACIRENNPTIMIKHKRLLGMSAEVPEEPYAIPLGQANVAARGQ